MQTITSFERPVEEMITQQQQQQKAFSFCYYQSLAIALSLSFSLSLSRISDYLIQTFSHVPSTASPHHALLFLWSFSLSHYIAFFSFCFFLIFLFYFILFNNNNELGSSPQYIKTAFFSSIFFPNSFTTIHFFPWFHIPQINISV
jgi:type II secretory pathway component PulF